MTFALALFFAAGLSGTWAGDTNGLPAVELKILQTGSQVSGTIGFYFQSRSNGSDWRLGPKSEVQLLSPKLDGKVLTFETIHHKKHGSPELGPNNRYRVEFVSDTEARFYLFRAGEPEKAEGPGLKLVRRK